MASTTLAIAMAGLRILKSVIAGASCLFWHRPRAPSSTDPQVDKLLAIWQADLGVNTTVYFQTHVQPKWDRPLLQKSFSEIVHPLTEKQGRGGVGVCSVPCNRRVAGSNLVYLKPLHSNLGQVARP